MVIQAKGFGLNTVTLRRFLLVSILLVMIAHLLTLTVYPRVFIDEGWLSNAAWTWLNTGINFDAMHTGTLDQFGYPWVARFFVGQAPYVLSFGLLGLGVFQARLVSWFFGLVLLFATVQAGRQTYGLTTGLLAALLLALSFPFLQASRWRQDIMLTAFIMLAFGLALWALHENKLWAHAAAGFLLGIGLDIHQAASLFIPALAAVYLVFYGRQVLFKRGTWLVGLGGALGIIIFAAIHIFPSPETYSRLMSFNFAGGAEAELPLMQPGKLISSALGELGRYGFRRNPLDLALIVVGALFLLRCFSRTDKLLLTFVTVAFINFILLSGNKTTLYAIHLYPFFMMIVAELFIRFLRRFDGLRPGYIMVMFALVLYVGYGTFQLVRTVSSERDYDYYAITNQIRAVIPDNARVLAMPMWWFGLSDYDFRSSLNLTYYNFFNDFSAVQSLEIIQPDYIVFDEIQSLLLADKNEELAAGLNGYAVSRDEFMSVLETRGEKVLEFSDKWHGTFAVYALTWDQ